MISRRKLVIGGAATLGLALTGCDGSSSSGTGSASEIAATLRKRFGSSGSLFGARYLELNETGDEVESFFASLARDTADESALGARIEEMIAKDCRAGRTLYLDHWMFSETEARVHALVHLHGGAS